MTAPRREADRRRYRWLLRLFPGDFRRRYGAEMEESFLLLLGSKRGLAAGTVWVRAALDAVLRGGRLRLDALVRRSIGSGGDLTVPSLASDLRYALRTLIRRPVFTLTAVLTLALGIGATTAVFSLVNGLLLRSLPYPDAHELVALEAENVEKGWVDSDLNMADAWDWRARSGALEDVAVYDEGAVNLTGGDRPELLQQIEVTSNVLSLLGVAPVLGRDFVPDDNREGAPPVAIVSHGFFERRLGGDASAVGSRLILDERPTTVIGVLPDDFVFLQHRPDLLVPFGIDPSRAERGDHDRDAIGRLRDGVSVGEARRAVNAVALQLQEEFPEANRGWSADVVSLRADLLGDVARRASLVLLGAVSFVLLMACTNVANLLLARADGRRAELAVRAALGAGRGRILRQLLVESGVLAALGLAAGLVLAVLGRRAMVAGLPADTPALFDFGMDTPVLAFAVAVSGLSALLFGLSPALRASSGTAAGLREGGRSAGASRRRRRFGRFLVVFQTALAVVLLVGAGVMIRSVVGITNQDPGFEPDGVLKVRMSPPADRYPDAASLDRLWSSIEDRTRAVPGVEAVGTIHAVPLSGANWGVNAWLRPEEDPRADEGHPARVAYISPGYFEAMGIEFEAGRGPERTDAGQALVWINESFAERHFPGEDPLGRRLVTSSSAGELTVTGVVDDHLARGIDQPPEATVFQLVGPTGFRGRDLVIRAEGTDATLVDAVQEAVWSVDPDLPVYDIHTMEEVLRMRVAGFRLIAQLMGTFGVASLVLGAVGIYGITAYAVGQRTREIGIRLAMGADRAGVVAMVLREGLLRVGVGLGLGLVLAFLLSRAMAGLLVGVSPSDPLTFGVVTATLAAVSLLGSWIPAHRASRVDPVNALSSE